MVPDVPSDGDLSCHTGQTGQAAGSRDKLGGFRGAPVSHNMFFVEVLIL